MCWCNRPRRAGEPVVVLMMTTWRDRGLCRGTDPGTFFPCDGDEAAEELAKAICAECAVREACLQHAIANREKVGVWGGLGERERRRLMRRSRKSA